MNPMLYLRKNVLKVKQADMARITGASQATVSRWENGELEPHRQHLAAVRDAAIAAGLSWDDAWLIEAPNDASDCLREGDAA